MKCVELKAKSWSAANAFAASPSCLRSMLIYSVTPPRLRSRVEADRGAADALSTRLAANAVLEVFIMSVLGEF